MAWEDVKILDCTFRDGGHLLNWNFKQETVENVVNTISKSGIDYFELGYRTSKEIQTNLNLGQSAISSDDSLRELKNKTGLSNITIMMDVGKVEKNDFCIKFNSPVDTIRVATYVKDIDLALEHVEDLEDKGYEVFLNLMALTHIKNDELIKVLKKTERVDKKIKALYFADSFGSMFPRDVKDIVKIIKDNTSTEIGFHGHNNLQMAFPNGLAAMESGVKYIDSTLYGQGRGAGNLPTEIICAYLNSSCNHDRFDIGCMVSSIQDVFLGCSERVDWGYSLESFITGINDVHPNQIKQFQDDKVSLLESYFKLKAIANE